MSQTTNTRAQESAGTGGDPDREISYRPVSAAAICALVQHDVGIHEYAAREVKQAVVGTGSGEKRQVQHMVGVLLGIGERLQADAADALALALAHAHTRASVRRLGIDLGDRRGRSGRRASWRQFR